jgi:hypothetical protein
VKTKNFRIVVYIYTYTVWMYVTPWVGNLTEQNFFALNEISYISFNVK